MVCTDICFVNAPRRLAYDAAMFESGQTGHAEFSCGVKPFEPFRVVVDSAVCFILFYGYHS